MEKTTVTYHHPDLGRLTGLARSPSVAQFRNVPYASIPARFRQSRLVVPNPASSTEQDYTQDGYACPQIPQTLAAFGGRLPGEPDRQYDEFSCLNLIISVPQASLQHAEDRDKKLLPVLVYVHGGAFSEGVHFGATHDTARMVELSVKENKPVVIDLVDEAATNHESPCNFGLHDQRNAFLWIRKHIPCFGGDPNNITAFAESAGSVSLCLHMCSTAPLFNRAILQSGTVATNAPPVSFDVQERQYQELLAHCGISNDDPARLDKLRAVPAEKLVAAITDLSIPTWSPWAEKGFFPIAPNYRNFVTLVEKCDWVKEFIVGDCCFEGFNFQAGLRDVTVENLTRHLEGLLGHQDADTLMKAYSISPDMDVNLFWRRIMEMGGDMVFSQPTHVLAKSLAANPSKTVYRYNIAFRNPFPGSMYTEIQGHHFIDLLFLFMTLSERYPTDRLRAASAEFARRWIDFANGLAPWEEYTLGNEAITVVDNHHGWTLRTREQDIEAGLESDGSGERRYRAWEVAAEILAARGEKAQEVLHQLQARQFIALANK